MHHGYSHVLTEDCSEIMFHVMTTDDNPIHALLKTSRMNSTALVAVDPITFEELQMWIFPNLISLTLNYERGVGIVFSYTCSQTQTLVEDEVKLFSLSPVVVSELKPFIDSFLKLRLGDIYIGIKIEERQFDPNHSTAAEAAYVPECAELKYVFRCGSNGVQVPQVERPQSSSTAYQEAHEHGTFPRRHGVSQSVQPRSSLDNLDKLERQGPFSLPLPSLPVEYSPFIARPPPVKLPPKNLLRPGVAPSR